MNRLLKTLPKLASLGALIILAACSDSVVTAVPPMADVLAAPALPKVVASQALVAQQVEAQSASNHGTLAAAYPSNAVTYSFSVNPIEAQSFVIGAHMVRFPRYTICDPSASSYGPSYWLTSCQKLTTPITITATTWTDSQGRPQIDFANALRFYKNYNNELPAIYLRDAWASTSSLGRVDYCTFSGSCVNEAATDGALVTQRDAATGFLFRLIRHFSGYNVWA
jgi:hypothetical protein